MDTSVEDRILENLYRLGFAKAWDGVVVAQRQWKNGLLVQETCRCVGISHTLLETCFITNEADMARLNNNVSSPIREPIRSWQRQKDLVHPNGDASNQESGGLASIMLNYRLSSLS